MEQDYVSIIGVNYLYPICRLLEELDSLNSSSSNQVQTSNVENGYSVVIIALTLFLLESFINRNRYDVQDNAKIPSLKFMRTIYPNSCLVDNLEELFVVRDVIVHNHVWEARFNTEGEAVELIFADLRKGYGDKKFNRVINPTNRKTRQLGINLFPTRICRTDVEIVLKNAKEFFRNLLKKYDYVLKWPIKFHRETKSFSEVIDRFCESRS